MLGKCCGMAPWVLVKCSHGGRIHAHEDLQEALVGRRVQLHRRLGRLLHVLLREVRLAERLQEVTTQGEVVRW